MSERERHHLLTVFEGLRAAKPTRTARAVDDEVDTLRRARRQGGRRHAP